MAEVSTQPSASARKLAQVILQRLATVKNQAVAEAIGKDESTISRIVSGESGIKVSDLQSFLAALSLKCVDVNQYCVPKEEYEAYRTLARIEMSRQLEQDWERAT